MCILGTLLSGIYIKEYLRIDTCIDKPIKKVLHIRFADQYIGIYNISSGLIIIRINVLME